YSSLSYLQAFPIDLLKIDRSFVAAMDRNTECREIIRTILSLAAALGLEVVAEGTETEEQVRDLASLGRHFAQGCFLGKPSPAHRLTSRRGSCLAAASLLATGDLDLQAVGIGDDTGALV